MVLESQCMLKMSSSGSNTGVKMLPPLVNIIVIDDLLHVSSKFIAGSSTPVKCDGHSPALVNSHGGSLAPVNPMGVDRQYSGTGEPPWEFTSAGECPSHLTGVLEPAMTLLLMSARTLISHRGSSRSRPGLLSGRHADELRPRYCSQLGLGLGCFEVTNLAIYV